jgi:carboxypeptidase C (cathepsin A)
MQPRGGAFDRLPGTAMPISAMTKLTHAVLALLIVVVASAAPAQEEMRKKGKFPKQQTKSEQKGEQKRSDESVLRLLPGDSVTRHSIETPAGKLEYIATAGTLTLFDQNGERSAAIFYTAYVMNTGEASKRPVTFVFNGGPGAASAYLHLGMVGPRVAEFGASGRDASATRLHDNPDTWLPFTDLVMIDPVGAGYSRPARADGGKRYWGVSADAEAMAKTVAVWLANNRRSASPKLLLGESYGGFRAAKVARALQRSQGISVSGIVMVSPFLEGAFTFGGTRFALGAALQLPSLAAAALERKGTFSMEKLAEAERFALTEYLTTLAGAPPKGESARAFYARVAEISGLPVDVVTRTRGFIRDDYIKNLRRDEGMIVSRYDATFAAPDPYPERAAPSGPDPMLDGVSRAYGGAFAAYARDELGFKTDMTYVLLSGEVSGAWSWGEGSGRAVASAEGDIRALLALEPSFRLLIVHGMTDMVTPYAVSRYVLDHLPDMGNPARAQLRLYRGGHMFYLDRGSRRDFTADARAFYHAEQ